MNDRSSENKSPGSDDRLAVFYDPRLLEHDTGFGFFEGPPSPYLDVQERHPENPERLRNMVSLLRDGPLRNALDWHQAEPATREQILLFHEPSYIDELAALDPTASRRVTGTSVFGPGSWPLVKLAAGLSVAAARQVWQGKSALAFALVRPPGHHAQPARADGYCFLNNTGIALQVLRREGLRRACVIDWDVHHGNGTQEGFYDDGEVLTVSLHMDHGAWGENHRQSGRSEEVGTGAGTGFNLNVPLPFGSGDAAYRRAFDGIVAPEVRAFAPEMIFIGAGQDANQFDPNGRQTVTMTGFRDLGRRARALAEELCGGKLVLIQEGGYAVSYAAYCLHATLEGVLGREAGLEDPIAYLPDKAEGIDAILKGLKETRKAELGAKAP